MRTWLLAGLLATFAPATASAAEVLFLDQAAVSLLRFEDEPTCFQIRRWVAPDPKGDFEKEKQDAFAPFLFLTDARLAGLKHKGRYTIPAPPPASYPWTKVSKGLPHPEPTKPEATIMLRACSLFHADMQAPASRLEWYTRWFGESRLPDAICRMNATEVDRLIPERRGFQIEFEYPGGRDWQDEFRQELPQAFLDHTELPLVSISVCGFLDTFLNTGPMNFDRRMITAIVQQLPINALFNLTDLQLLQHGPTAKPASISIGESTPEKEIVRRAYACFSIASQVPASRLEWYTRWYGEASIPTQFSSRIVEEQSKIENPQVFSFVMGLFGGN